jgi:hypothetical protein
MVSMALKRKITKEGFDELDETKQSFYVEKDGNYFLDMEDEDTGALLRAKEHEKENRVKAEKEAKALRDRLAQIEEDGLRKRGDVEALEKSWNEKHSSVIQEMESRNAALKNSVKKQILESKADALASKLSMSPSLLKRAILERLEVDFDSESGPALRILDVNGKPSATTFDELEKEILANKEYAPILYGSKASGGGATSKSVLASGAPDKPNKPLSRMSPIELTEYLKSKGE